MFPRISPLCLVVAGSALVLTGAARAQLASKSPFQSAQAAANTPTAGAPLEFRGYMETAEGRLYRIYDPAKKASTWIKLNEKNTDFDVVAKQQDDKMLTIEHQGRTLTLALREPKIVSSGSGAQPLPPPPTAVAPSNVPAAVTQAVVLNPTPADEQRRLEAVAAEVARRRALREQASQQITQGQTPQVNVPQPVMPQSPGRPQNSQPQGPAGTQRVAPPPPQSPR